MNTDLRKTFDNKKLLQSDGNAGTAEKREMQHQSTMSCTYAAKRQENLLNSEKKIILSSSNSKSSINSKSESGDEETNRSNSPSKNEASSKLSFISNDARTTGTKLSIRRRRIERKTQFKSIVDQIFHEESAPDSSKKKLEYFYSAYSGLTLNKPYMEFEDHSSSSESQKAQAKWATIMEHVLLTGETRFTEFLKTVNKEMYMKLIGLAKKYCMKLLLNNKLDGGKDEIFNTQSNPATKSTLAIKDIKLLKPLLEQVLFSKDPQALDSKTQIPRTEIIPALSHIKGASNCPNSMKKCPSSHYSTKIVPEYFHQKLISQSINHFVLQSGSADMYLARETRKIPKRASVSRSSVQTNVANPVRPKFTNPYKLLNMSIKSKKSSMGSSSASTKASWSSKKIPKTRKILARKSCVRPNMDLVNQIRIRHRRSCNRHESSYSTSGEQVPLMFTEARRVLKLRKDGPVVRLSKIRAREIIKNRARTVSKHRISTYTN
ncbi:unnamed protein product [Moneuplotes crassus]|uniref:Uncharacterized protein n=1 Tax=Euplotes crassus TaxID=5936 RepID=A0AAD1UBB1_EUPCR|nr:unnamed protein product [Moneuplotes crassus]